MGVGLHLQILKSAHQVPSGYYVITATDPGMAAHNSRKIHEGDWLESINQNSVDIIGDVRCGVSAAPRLCGTERVVTYPIEKSSWLSKACLTRLLRFAPLLRRLIPQNTNRLTVQILKHKTE
jgi:hypothetical protein